MAENLTTQVRAIAEVSTAVTQGDLTRSITVEARGEVAALKDNLNEMIRNLKDTTLKNEEQDWLKTNLARFSSMLQGQRDMTAVANLIQSQSLAGELQSQQDELRTPLNSMLILSRQLAENIPGNLDNKQVQFAETIHSSGADLLSLINDILDPSKIKSGMMATEVGETPFVEIAEQINRSFHQVAADKRLEFSIERAENLPPVINTDQKRPRQVLRNLLSNAFKFTEKGHVSLNIGTADRRRAYAHEALSQADQVIAFSVTDTGIGIPVEKQRIIFEAFQQADGTTSRKYGGTGLGLSISREIARLLGGEIRVVSAPGEGSAFTLYLPRAYKGEWGVGSGEWGKSSHSPLPTPYSPLRRLRRDHRSRR